MEISQEMINIKQAEAEKRRSAVSIFNFRILIFYALIFSVDNSRKSKICEIFQCKNAKLAHSERPLSEPGGVRHRESS